MKINIKAKLIISYLVVLLVGAIILISIASISIPAAYGRHFGEYGSLTTGTEVPGVTKGRGQGSGMGMEMYMNFQNSFYEALGWALLGSVVVAIVLSLVLSARFTAPLRKLSNASRRIAEGHLGERVSELGNDEIGQLAVSFNTMAERLEHVERMRRRLIGDIAHELRTPLTAIKGSMEGLIDEVLMPNADTFLQVANETERLNRLVNDLHELSYLESGSFKLERASISVPDLVNTVYKRLAPAFLTKSVEFKIDMHDTIPEVFIDSDRVIQVMTNLLNNALQYTPSGGRVVFSCEVKEDDLIVIVSDNGIGITAEHLNLIFDRFYRVDPSRSRISGSGSGIGLTISKYLVEAHGGRIWAESDGENKGSKFIFTLPITCK